MRVAGLACAALCAVLLGACGSDSPTATVATSTAPGTLIYDPPLRVASLDAFTLGSQLGATATGQELLQLAGAPQCGVDFYYIKYYTLGGAGETTTASGALMIPTGSAAQCAGSRPIVLYAHGTTTDKNYNIADITGTLNPADAANGGQNSAYAESALMAATFAAQGYIVVAPNYAGYDISTLPYHPFLNAAQQSGDMIDALTAARTALPHSFTPATVDSGQLFITGYSEGGFVAMATNKALQGQGKTVTAAAPASGPYALEAFGDAVFYGEVNIDSTVFAPLITTSYQKAYGNIYTQTTDVYEPAFATGIDTLLPSTTPIGTLIADGKLPETALFSNTPPDTGNAALNMVLAPNPNPPFSLGFGANNLITSPYRISYVEDALANPDGAVPTPQAGVPLAASPKQTLRIAFKTNDLRSWTPMNPLLMCGADGDPTVFYSVNTETMAAFWTPEVSAGLVSTLDLAATPGAGDPFAPLQLAFQKYYASLVASEGEAAAVASYHGSALPFCIVAARSFFGAF